MRIFALFICFAIALCGQQDLAKEWLSSLQALEARVNSDSNPSASARGEMAAELTRIHREVRTWAESNDVASLAFPAPPSGDDLASMHAAVTRLRAFVEETQRRMPSGIFNLGRIEVDVYDDANPSLTTVRLDEAEYRQRDLRVLPDALNLVPGVSIQRIGPRNERGIFIRGFDVRQVPLYIDGIPVYVPYDGYVDMDRFLTYDVSQMDVSKGFTSPLYGPNAIGGAVNLITKAPDRPLMLDMGTGYASGDQVHGFVNAGTRKDRFWLQGGFAWLSSDGYPLSGNFQPTPAQADGRRVNAYQTDHKTRIRAGWTPNDRDQYTFTYAIQKGEKGNPPYAGTDPGVRVRYWQWPSWDKESFYFIGNKSLGETSYLRGRLFYDKFDNMLLSFDNNQYNSQTLPSSFSSPYDDDTYGTSMEWGTRGLAGHNIRSSFYFKDDTHREGNLGSPMQSFRDQTMSFGLEDTVKLAANTSAVLGLSFDRLQVLNAEHLVSGVMTPFPLSDVNAWNPQAGIFHTFNQSAKLRFTFARKTRLPTIKDRYSYRMGQAIPNPDLREERTNNWEVGYTQLVGHRTYVEVSLFRSDVSNSTQRFYLQPNLFQFRNIGEARYLGSEFGIKTSVTSRLLWNANYTYLSRKNTFDPAMIMLDTPRHNMYTSASWLVNDRFSVLADLRYEGGRHFQNEAGRFGRATNFATVSFSGNLRLYQGTEIQAGVNNLFDRHYLLVDGFPEAGRNAFVNLRYRF